ncbi:MAG: DMT family transporter [Burkholderiales bacterium]|nr:DMT family transporter [Burkholderiales bacterium]
MKPANYARLLLLGAIWGFSFIFLRVASPVFGPLLTSLGRVACGALVLAVMLHFKQTPLAWRHNLRTYTVIGLFNTAIPFSLFAWAALYVPSAYMATANAMAPLFTAMFGVLLIGETLTPARVIGLVLGLTGVAVLVGIGPAPGNAGTFAGIVAALLAAVCYGYAAVYTRRFAGSIPPLAIATGSSLCAAVALLPIALTAYALHPVALPADMSKTWHALGAVLLLGAICTAVAYALFYRLIAEEGVSQTITVTFLIPGAAVIWAALFLSERVTLGTLAGLGLVLLATGLVLGVIRLPTPFKTRLPVSAAK